MTGKSLKSKSKKILINLFNLSNYTYAIFFIILAILFLFITSIIGGKAIEIGEWVVCFFIYIVAAFVQSEEDREKEKRKNEWPYLNDQPSSCPDFVACLDGLLSIIVGIAFFIGGIAFLVFLVKFFWKLF